MEEKYFIIDVKNQKCGPFTEDELNDIGLYQDSLILCSDWQGQKPLNQIPELAKVNRKNTSIMTSFPDYGKPQIKQKDIEVLVNPYTFKRKKIKIITVSWLFFHLMALILSSIGIQNKEESDSYDKFWPNVRFFEEGDWHPTNEEPFNRRWYEFQGVFFEYDISEFSIYILLFGFIWFLLFTKNQKS